MSAPFPPQPWHLRGRGRLTLWRVRAEAAPALPPGAVALPAGRGHVLATTMFVDYRPGGDLVYGELLAGVLVRSGLRPSLTISDIWVDSPSSQAGARALWAVPKQLATFHDEGRQGDAHTGEGLLASVRERPGRLPRLPGLPTWLPGSVLQERDGAALLTPVRARGRVRPAHLDWTIPLDGPLAWIAGSRSLTSLVAEDVRLTFGA